jgi:hypothetical protein
MKKKLLVSLFLFIAFINSQNYFGQAVLLLEAPIDNTTTQVRAPNGLSTYAYLRACALVLQSELTNLPTGSSISQFGFTLATTSTVSVPVAGNFTVYLQNTTDVSYLKGTNWATIPTGMTSVYANVMTIPLSSTSTSIILTLSTPFSYSGGGLYVAYDWDSTGPFSSTPATYLADGGANLSPGCASASSSTAAPTTLGTTAFRPSFLFGITNPYTNDVQVIGLTSPGKVNVSFNTPHTIEAVIRNSGSTTQNNINVNLNVTGANTFANTQTITSLAAGASTTVIFSPFNPQLIGANTVSVNVPSDQNNINNSGTYSQSVTCDQWAQNPATGSFTSNAVGFGTGSGILATPFLNPVTSSIIGIRGAISNNINNSGNSLYAVLLSSTGAVIATTNTITLTSAVGFQNFSFSTPQALTANTTYYLGIAQIANSTTAYYPAGTQSSAYLPANLYFSTPLIGGVLTAITQNYGYFGLEAIFADANNITAMSSSTAICNGKTATLTASGANTYTWNGSSLSSSIIVTPSSNTAYSVSGTSTIGCISSTVINLNVNPLPNVSAISSNSAICLGKTVTLTASGAATYSWDNGPTTNSISETPSATTVYSVTGISALGCSNSQTVEVVVNSFTPGITSSTALCLGEQLNIQLTGGTGNTYTWSSGTNGFSGITVTPTLTTVYSATAIGANLCYGSNSTTITVNSIPVVLATAQRTNMCKGETNTLTASGAVSYSWSGGSNPTNATNVISPSNNITYTYFLTGTNAEGCTNTASVSVKVNACTSISENSKISDLVSIFPNPSNGLLNVRFETQLENASLEIRNVLGAVVLRKEVTETEIKLDLKNQPNGIYFILIQLDNKTINTHRIIIQ